LTSSFLPITLLNMSNFWSSSDIPADASTRREWIKLMLHSKGWTLTQVAEDLQVSKQAVSLALRAPNQRIEQRIADILGIPVPRLFPERYSSSTGRRTARVYRRKRSASPAYRNGRAEVVA